jgi:hypothetical protein
MRPRRTNWQLLIRINAHFARIIDLESDREPAQMPSIEFAVMTRWTTIEAMLKALAAMMVLLPLAALGLLIVMLVFR